MRIALYVWLFWIFHAGSDHVSSGIRVFRERNYNEEICYYKNFTPEDYAKVLNNAICCLGNSSSFIREGCFLGVPSVVVGDRQKNREHGINASFTAYARNKILEKLKNQVANGRYKPDQRFGNGEAGTLIAKELSEIKL